ncbi:MAG: gliding motility-associated C-terminal domain-containing protein [Bacteroidales bacterium]|jgi:gliding motility-associated-like protein|nr:gliding motility-associated C-terminal domain-containing protein [Bacteroidales bacterium]
MKITRVRRYLMIMAVSAIGATASGQPAWTVNPTQYQSTMSVTAQLNIEGNLSANTGDMIGVFYGDDCRGKATNSFPLNDQQYAMLTVYGNTTGELLTLKIYEAATDKIYSLKQYFRFVKDSTMGTYDAPVVFYTNLTLKKLAAYNYFSPNGDGKNEQFIVDDLIAVSGMTFKVMTRQGVTVFEQKDYDNLWEGKDKNGNDLPQGVYYYLFTDADGQVIYKGSITLVR